MLTTFDVGWVVCLLAGAGAEQGPILELDEVVRWALERNENTHLAATRLQQARARRREAYAQLFPDLSVVGTYTRRPEITTEIQGEQVVIQRQDTVTGVGTISSTLLDASAIPDVRSAEKLVDREEAQREETTRALAFEAAESFYAALIAQGTVSIAERREALAKSNFENAQSRFNVGLVGCGEVNRTELELATAELEKTRAENALRLARLSLGFVINHEVTGVLREPEELARSPAADVEGALSIRPDVRVLVEQLEAAQRARWVPWLGLIPSLQLDGNLVASDNVATFQGRTVNWSLALSLQWMLFDGGRRYAQAALRDADVEEAKLLLEAQRRRVRLEVRSAVANVELSRAAVVQAERRSRIAEENRREVEERFRQGLASALEQTDAATEAFEAATVLQEERLNAALSGLALQRALGGWPSAARPVL